MPTGGRHFALGMMLERLAGAESSVCEMWERDVVRGGGTTVSSSQAAKILAAHPSPVLISRSWKPRSSSDRRRDDAISRAPSIKDGVRDDTIDPASLPSRLEPPRVCGPREGESKVAR